MKKKMVKMLSILACVVVATTYSMPVFATQNSDESGADTSASQKEATQEVSTSSQANNEDQVVDIDVT